MAVTRAALRRKINRLLDEFEPELKKGFLESVRMIASTASLKLLTEAIATGNLTGALDALDMERAAFAPLEQAISRAYNAGGLLMANNMPTLRGMNGAKITVRFDSRNPRAEDWLRRHSGGLITRVIDEQRAAVQLIVERGLRRGQNPNTTAREIIGKFNRATGRREGGVLGLLPTQIEYVQSARDELASGDVASLRRYMKRLRRDRRYDRAVLKAIKAGGLPVDAETIRKATSSYANRLLALRGETIARTETLTAIHSAKHEAFAQGLEKTNYPPEAVTRTWRSASDTKVRHTHAAMDGQVAHGLETPFVSPSGALLRFPGDTQYGAPAEEIINCRCDDDLKIDFSFGVT